MNLDALMKIEYGLYCLTARKDDKDNGCIINTVNQVTLTPCRLAIAVNKLNYTHDIIVETKEFNLSVLTTKTPFSVFKNFGYQSGKTVDKFTNCDVTRSANGICYLTQYANSYFSCKVETIIDLGTHSLFIAEVTQAEILNNEPTVNYSYYLENIKETSPATPPKHAVWQCKICGYIYDGDPLPADFICPLCKHGAIDFEKIE